MEYRVIINPSKEQEFLQLLKAWQSLEVVLDFGLLEDNDEKSKQTLPLWHKTREKSPRDLAEEYRDLVD